MTGYKQKLHFASDFYCGPSSIKCNENPFRDWRVSHPLPAFTLRVEHTKRAHDVNSAYLITKNQ
jgi:hypothetical protein